MLFTSPLLSQDYVRQDLRTEQAGKSATYKSFTRNGAWCWFSDPRAVYHEGRFKRTYAGWIDNYGNVTISYYDHTTREIRSVVLQDSLQIDDHDNPALLFTPDGRLMVFFTRHGDPGPTFLCTMKNPEDITGWDRQELYLNDMIYYRGFANTNTYVNPVLLTGENNRIYLFWRGVDNKPNYSFSDDMGKTWSEGRIFVLPERVYEMRRPYMKVESNGKDKIMFAFTDGHPNSENENSIYFMFYENGHLFNAQGEKIGTLGEKPVNPRQASVVYDAAITGQKAWIWDIAMDKKENPVIVYVKFPDNQNHIYCYARWNGRKWKNYDLINSGACFPQDEVREQNYSGGLVLDHENPHILYLSVKRESNFEIEKWDTKSGKKWKRYALTIQSGKDNVRPFAVRYARRNNPLQLLWMENNYYIHYTDYYSSIKMNILHEK
jgi:hypothetical protein